MPLPGYYWPFGAQRGRDLNALISCFEAIGYILCDNDELEDGFEKVALFADQWGVWTHAAKQLDNGHWSSKLGDCEDIMHEKPYHLNSKLYGQVACCMKRVIGGKTNAEEG